MYDRSAKTKSIIPTISGERGEVADVEEGEKTERYQGI
jgi:hypothetical protein